MLTVPSRRCLAIQPPFPAPRRRDSVILSRSLHRIPPEARAGAISVGNFDGVHRGHALLIRELRCQADRVRGPAVVITFDPHPAAILRPNRQPPRLTGIERRAELLGKLGVDHVVVCHTDRAFLQKTASEFFEHVVTGSLAAKAMVEGPNFFFGRNREGDIDRLRMLCQRAEIDLSIVEPSLNNQKLISSTRIRNHLLAGEIEQANELLTAPYALRGRVISGESRGATIGFPTANLGELENMIPQHGVYGSALELQGQRFVAATHIGPNPTFDEQRAKVEVHILDWEGDLYGQTLQVDFLFKVRDIARFDSVDALRQQLKTDIAQVRHTIQ